MKTAILAIVLCLSGISTAYPQSNEAGKIGTTEHDTIVYIGSLANRKDEFIGKPLCDFLSEYTKHVNIQFMGVGTTSPWVDPEGKSYVNSITLSHRDSYDMSERDYERKGNFVLQIEFENPHEESSEFWKQIPDHFTDAEKAKSICHKYTIKDIRFFKSQILP